MQIPTLSEAESLLLEAQACNPGRWVAHSRCAAQGARLIAEQVAGMEGDTAYILGLLHDIGRRFGSSDMLHILDGYHWMMDHGFADSARICLTHSFPLQDVRTMQYNWDGTPEEMAFIGGYLERITYTDYDRLIQLCDAFCLPEGFCLIEKRMVDVALRLGIHDYVLPKWRAFFEVQRHFEAQLGRSIYSLLPGVVETTFGVRL